MFNNSKHILTQNIIHRHKTLLCLGDCGQTFISLTVNTEFDFSTGVAHRAGGGADVNACILCGRVGDVEVSFRVRLERGAVLGQRLPPLEEQQALDENIPQIKAVRI